MNDDAHAVPHDIGRVSHCNEVCSTRHVWQAKEIIIRRCSAAESISGYIGHQEVTQRQVYKFDVAHTAVMLVSHGYHMGIACMGSHGGSQMGSAVMTHSGVNGVTARMKQVTAHVHSHVAWQQVTRTLAAQHCNLLSLTIVNMQAQCLHTYIIL